MNTNGNDDCSMRVLKQLLCRYSNTFYIKNDNINKVASYNHRSSILTRNGLKTMPGRKYCDAFQASTDNSFWIVLEYIEEAKYIYVLQQGKRLILFYKLRFKPERGFCATNSGSNSPNKDVAVGTRLISTKHLLGRHLLTKLLKDIFF